MPPAFQLTDREAEQLLINRLQEHGLLEVSEPEVWVRQGTAYIEGTVPNLRQKKLAGDIARQVNGIREVVNRLRITPLPVLDDDSLRKHIRRALVRNPKIDESRVTVAVMNGVVYLGGFASTAAEKRLAEQEAWSTPGVREIVNRVEVLSATPKSEIEIVSEILRSFSDCLGLDLSKITVQFKDGTVHLRGTVPSNYLREAAEELATWTPAVTSVVNELKVLELPGFRGFLPPRLVRSPHEDCAQSRVMPPQESAPRVSGSSQAVRLRSSTNAS